MLYLKNVCNFKFYNELEKMCFFWTWYSKSFFLRQFKFLMNFVVYFEIVQKTQFFFKYHKFFIIFLIFFIDFFV